MAIASPPRSTVSVEAFEAFIARPENAARKFELIHGEIVEVPTNGPASIIAMLIGRLIGNFLAVNNLPGHMTGADGGFNIAGHIFAPDTAYVDRWPPARGFIPFPPILAVEVISNPDNGQEMRTLMNKSHLYRDLGIVLWVVDAEARTIQVIDPAANTTTLYGVGDTLVAGAYLHGFELAVGDLFPQGPAEKSEGAED